MLELTALFLSALAAPSQHVVVLQAGTIHLVANGEVIEGGGSIVVRDGKIEAIGKDLPIPPGARVVDYGADAIVTPGLVAADSTYGFPRGGERTADPFVRAIDSFDAYASYVFALQEGVTSAYLAPGRGRLIAGQGAVVKLGGGANAQRVLSESAAIHGAVSAEARGTPGYWKPPIPATSDTGLGIVKEQLPKSLMGAMVALQELLALAQGGKDDGEYGPGVGQAMRELMQANLPWRLAARTDAEVRAITTFASENGLRVIVDGADAAGDAADAIAAAGLSVIVDAPIAVNQAGRDFGKDRDAVWPRYDTATKLAKAGVRFAISVPDAVSANDLRFAASVMRRGGLSADEALRAITLAPAEILGVESRVGSLAPGKDADLVVWNGSPVDVSSGVLATWIDGEIVFKAYETGAVVVHVDELHVGDGTVLQPGEILMRDGKIQEVARRVGRPSGATVVRAASAMPGMIDALGHLGLDGSTKVPQTRFEMKRIVEPGDHVDRRVARSGVTTVALAPRNASRSGAPVMAYKPAGDDLESMVIADPCALRFEWTDRNRRESGNALRDLLKKAADYAKKWSEYETKLAQWTPPKEPAPQAKPAADAKSGEDAKAEGDEKKEGAADAEKKDGEEKKDEKKAKKKKGEEEPPKPVTGSWETKVTVPPFAEARLRLYLNDVAGAVTGSMRCSSLSDSLVELSGKRDGHKLTLAGDGSKGRVTVEGEVKEGKLKGKVSVGATKVDFEALHASTEYEVVRRTELRKAPEEKTEAPAGKPKAPAVDPDLEPLRRAMNGEGAVIVGVNREDEILACVEAFEAAGIAPILFGANEAWKVADQIRDRVAGVLLSQRVLWSEPEDGAKRRNAFAQLSAAGIPIAFHSAAEEGAADLPLIAAYAVAQGMSADSALRALTHDAAQMLAISDRVGGLSPGLDADVVLLDGAPLDPASNVVRVFVGGKEIR